MAFNSLLITPSVHKNRTTASPPGWSCPPVVLDYYMCWWDLPSKTPGGHPLDKGWKRVFPPPATQRQWAYIPLKPLSYAWREGGGSPRTQLLPASLVLTRDPYLSASVPSPSSFQACSATQISTPSFPDTVKGAGWMPLFPLHYSAPKSFPKSQLSSEYSYKHVCAKIQHSISSSWTGHLFLSHTHTFTPLSR